MKASTRQSYEEEDRDEPGHEDRRQTRLPRRLPRFHPEDRHSRAPRTIRLSRPGSLVADVATGLVEIVRRGDLLCDQLLPTPQVGLGQADLRVRLGDSGLGLGQSGAQQPEKARTCFGAMRPGG